MENDLGDPQKALPCGGTSANAGTPSNVVNKVQGGQKLHLKVQETVYHPGHYRASLAVNRADLPQDPEVATKESARGPQSVSAVCTLQIVEFMAEHGLNRDGGYFYHHCADLQITADRAKPIDTRWPAAR